MKLLFLGTGAADWNGPDEAGEERRYSSALIDGRILLDCTRRAADLMPSDARVTDVFITHSHWDHFDIDAIRALAPVNLHVYEGWADQASGEGVRVCPLKIGEPVSLDGITVTPLPANHPTDRPGERALIYLIEAGDTRLLYSTDSAWIPAEAAKIAFEKPLTALVIEATVGPGLEDDYRVFEHNTLEMAGIMVKSMQKNGHLPPDAPVYLTHMARTLYPEPSQTRATAHPRMTPARDGLELSL